MHVLELASSHQNSRKRVAQLPRLLMSHMKPKHCLKPNRKRQSNHELSDDAIEAAIKRVDEWEGQTRDLLLSMFDSQMIERCDGAVPFIPFKSNTQPDRGTDVWSKMFYFYNYKRDEFMSHYHKRSNVESVFQMIKSKFGEKLRSKNETAQINEALTKVLCHNLCVVIQSMYELDVAPEFASGPSRLARRLILTAHKFQRTHNIQTRTYFCKDHHGRDSLQDSTGNSVRSSDRLQGREPVSRPDL